VPQFLSEEWVIAFNAALADVTVTAEATQASIVASSGSFVVEQVVSGVPGTGVPVHTLLTVTPGALSLRLDPGGSTDPSTSEPPRANVIVSVSYEDAAALAAGTLDPARALGEGRIRVNGDLAVLVASQSVLASAAERLARLQAATTY
jgi:SCP-2 sterol transfer family